MIFDADWERKILACLVLLAGVALTKPAFGAVETVDSGADSPTTAPSLDVGSLDKNAADHYHSPDKKHKLRKRREAGEKEAEGTEAPKRFNPDINIKSKYEFHGQPIEVDTD